MPVKLVEVGSLQQVLAAERSPEVCLVTNETDATQIPQAVRAAAERVEAVSELTPDRFRAPARTDAAFLWFSGEGLLQGAPEAMRRNARQAGRTSFLIVHFPGVPDIDLLALQPRILTAGKTKEESVDFSIRIHAGATGGRVASEVLREMPEPWARLSHALYQDQAEPGSGLAQLDRLQRDKKLPPILDALVLRNLIILQDRHGRPQQALKLLSQARRKYADYGELTYIEAILALRTGDAAGAVKLLEAIIGKPKGFFAGSGGETTYRAQWLLGVIGDLVGNQAVACSHYQPGVRARPSFEPSVIGFLKQRLPPNIVDAMQWELGQLARRERRYLEPVFYFLLVHRAFSAARRMLDTMELGEAQRGKLLEKFNSVYSCYQKRPAGSSDPTGIILTGPFFVHSSVARINVEIAGALLSRTDFSAGLEPHGFALISPRIVTNGDAIARGLYRRPRHLDLTIRHHWPHDFSAPSAGKLAAIVPWEFGAVPRAWVAQIEKNVDELWVPSRFVKDVFVRNGVPSERIAIVPNGVNVQSFCPDGKSWKPAEARGFTFLFVGGAIERKGIDLLVKAYQRAFTTRDDVSLIIKDIGSTSFYRHMTLVPLLLKEATNPEKPRMIVLLDEFDEMKLAELYRGCDALVLPYRGEGFGMPLLEAMACGKPVITTAAGPAPEFCPADCSYFIPAKTVPVPGEINGFGELAAEPTWFEPEVNELADAMRDVYENQPEAACRGARAGEIIRPAYNWRRVTEMYIDRIAALTNRELSLAVPALHSAD